MESILSAVEEACVASDVRDIANFPGAPFQNIRMHFIALPVCARYTRNISPEVAIFQV